MDTGLLQVEFEPALKDMEVVPAVFNKSAAPDWMMNVESFTGSCAVARNCLRSIGLPGSCTVRVDPAKAKPLCSTTFATSGKDSLLINGKKYRSDSKSIPCDIVPKSDIRWTATAESSVFNLCWHDKKVPHNARLAASTVPLYSKCLWVNGLCWLWASPCSGACATVTLGDQHPGNLRYATQAEWDASHPTLHSKRDEFYSKCAASLLEHNYTHCDNSDVFSRHGPSGVWASDELVLIYEQFDNTSSTSSTGATSTSSTGATGATSTGATSTGATSTGATGATSTNSTGAIAAVGDPHLVNVFGQRFDLHQIGQHMLLQVPLTAEPVDTLLRVDAEARQLGDKCGDTYFTSLNVTGSWVRNGYGIGSMRFKAGDSQTSATSRWLHFGQVDMKIAKGRTARGFEYLNFYVRHLSSLTLRVGGLLGEDDHTAAETPTAACTKSRVSLVGMM